MSLKHRIKTGLPFVILLILLVIKTAEGSLGESGKLSSSSWIASQIQHSRDTTDDTALAARSLQVQRQSFLSVLLSYLARPEENPENDGANPSEEAARNNDVSQLQSRYDDSSIHLRVLRSTSEPEPRALFFRTRASQFPTSLPRRQPSRPSTAVGQPVADLAELLHDLQRRRSQQLVNGEAEETSATIEVVQTRTPFVITPNGQMIMNDLPMVERRSIPQFGGMVTLYTRTSPLRLLYYGNWCGSGGMGPALDEIDKCCMTHDQCYGNVEKQPCKVVFQKPYTVHYAWRWVEERKQAYCLRTGDRCADMTCECDRTAAACFAKHMINAKLEGNRLRKHRNRVKYPLRSQNYP